MQNAFLTPGPTLPSYTFGRTEDNSALCLGRWLALQLDGSNAIPLILDQGDATVLPTIGFIIEILTSSFRAGTCLIFMKTSSTNHRPAVAFLLITSNQ